ncbi:FecR family protein [Desertibaculum subflavum]|uniref:FecR family protein n=1 Tax=Desertibaculum subflavum TaxID=2268458 RepID=UPI000E672DFC
MSKTLPVHARRQALKASALALAGAVMLAVSALPAAAQSMRTCAVSRLVGEGVVIREGIYSRAEIKQRLRPNDRIGTGAGAKIEITCSDGIIVVVGESSMLDLGRLSEQGTSDAVLELLEGIVRFILPERRPAGRFEVTTPTAVASVRSTEWLAQVTPRGTAVLVMRGSVAVQGKAGGSATVLAPGEGVDVAPGAVAPPAVRWGQARIDRAIAAVTF